MGNCTSKSLYMAKENFIPLVPIGNNNNTNSNSSSDFPLLSFEKGDELKSKPKEYSNVTKRLANEAGLGAEETFMYMKNTRTKEKGFVCVHYMAEKGSLECQDWYFGKIGRGRAACFLEQECNIEGSYLIRASDAKPNCYAISVKAYNSNKSQYECKHYLIKYDGSQYYITESQKFSTLDDMAEACKRNNLRGIGVKLSNICQRPRPSANDLQARQGSRVVPSATVEYTEKDKIGGGNFGDVYKGKFRGNVEVAVKTLKADKDDGNAKSEKAATEFRKETEILMQLHHPNLVQIFAIANDAYPLLMILEFLPKGDLKRYLVNHGRRISFDQLLSICENVACGMRELESKNIVHRDLAARNVMLDSWLQAKVGDFGLARQDTEYETKAKGGIPVRWTAPEALKFRKFTSKSDVWSFAIVLYEVFSLGQVPYSHIQHNSEILGELERGFRLKKPEFHTDKKANENKLPFVYKVMLTCWLENPKRRPTFESLHNDFRDFDAAMENSYAYDMHDFMEQEGQNNDVVNINNNRRKTSNPNLKAPPPTVPQSHLTPGNNRRRGSSSSTTSGGGRKSPAGGGQKPPPPGRPRQMKPEVK